jgi:inner membrane transporter RhtA
VKIQLPQPPPTTLVLLSIISVQIGAALAKTLFDALGPIGVVSIRVSFSALILFACLRLSWNDTIRQNAKLIALFGLIFAVMNSSFYFAIDRLPLGIAIALEFVGPLGLSLLKSKRWLDGFWAVLAGVGIVLLTPLSGAAIDGWGVFFALFAGLFWAFYIIVAARMGQAISGMAGLAWALAVSSLLLLPFGIATAGSALLNPQLLAMGLLVSVLSTTLPYMFEMMALRSLSVQIFGILLSLEPMAGALVGLVILKEALTVRSLTACILISIAAAGATYFKPAPAQP